MSAGPHLTITIPAAAIQSAANDHHNSNMPSLEIHPDIMADTLMEVWNNIGSSRLPCVWR